MPEAQDTSCNYQGHAVLIAAGRADCERCKRVLSVDVLRKCKHGVFMPSGDSINSVCSICRCEIAEIDFRPDANARAAVLKTLPGVEDDPAVQRPESSDEIENEEYGQETEGEEIEAPADEAGDLDEAENEE